MLYLWLGGERPTSPPQMRNSGLVPAHLYSSMATLLDLPCWIKPPQCAPEHVSSDVTPFAEAHLVAIICKMIIALYQEVLVDHLRPTTEMYCYIFSPKCTGTLWDRLS